MQQLSCFIEEKLQRFSERKVKDIRNKDQLVDALVAAIDKSIY